MTTSERIRAAALGPTPKCADILMQWVGDGEAWFVVWQQLPEGTSSWAGYLNDDERRTLLLFVAEAVK